MLGLRLTHLQSGRAWNIAQDTGGTVYPLVVLHSQRMQLMYSPPLTRQLPA